MSKILFLGTDASRTGAPVVLMNLLRWMKKNTPHELEVFLERGGPLLSEFEELCRTTCRQTLVSRRSAFQRVVNRLGFTYQRPAPRVRPLYESAGIKVVYANTVLHGDLLAELAGWRVPIVCHVHELESMIQKYGADNFAAVKRFTSRFIAVSEQVRENLVRTHGVDKDKIDVVHAFVPVRDISARAAGAADLRASLGIDKEALVVGGSGFTNWRKGKDLFVQLAMLVRQKEKRPVHFLWVGGREAGEEAYQVRYDIEHAGLQDRVHVVPETDNPACFFTLFDVFAMVSREDPFPLVNLEAASLAKPIVCFEGAGGTPELVEEDAGFSVPYLDVAAMADKVLRLAQDESLRRQLGQRAAEKVRERHDVDVAAPAILRIVQGLLGSVELGTRSGV